MAELICLFHDYLSDLSPFDKINILREAETEILTHPEVNDDQQQEYNRLPRESYRGLVEELRRVFARNAPVALAAFVVASPDTEAARRLSGASREAIHIIRETGRTSRERLPFWALDPRNWFLISSEESPFTLQSRVSARFPCVVFGNGPIECASVNEPDVSLERLEDILDVTGIPQLWRRGNLGQAGFAVVLDTGVSSALASEPGIIASAAAGLSPRDTDGHGSAIVGLIRALSPQSQIMSICVTQSYSGGQIWNLIAGLSRLHRTAGVVVNLSLGVSLEWMRGLGPQALGFREAISNLLASLAAQGSFAISAAGNDGLAELRWPAACLDSLAVASHNSAFKLSSFSNYRGDAQNLILAPGGDVRQLDGRIDGFGRYGHRLTRDVYGTSFSTAVASALACLLTAYGWFKEMQIASRISLFRHHFRRSDDGYPILNVADIGAVWPI